MKKYIYFIHYMHISGNGDSGPGSAEVTRDKKIKSLDDIREIEKNMREKDGFRHVVIDNWIKLTRNMKV